MIEVVNKVAADDLTRRAFAAESVCDEAEVFLQSLLSVNHLNKLYEAAYDIIRKILIIADRDNRILVRLESCVLGGIPFSSCIDQPWNIK